MKVVLQRDFQGPDFTLYEAKNGVGVEVPDEFKDVLPADAKVITVKDFIPSVEGQPLITLADHDVERHSGDLETAFKGKRAK